MKKRRIAFILLSVVILLTFSILFVCRSGVRYGSVSLSHLSTDQLARLDQAAQDQAVPAADHVIRLSFGKKEAFLVPMTYANMADVGNSGTQNWTAGLQFLYLTADDFVLLNPANLECTITVGENTGIRYSGDPSFDLTSTATQQADTRSDWWVEFSLATLDSGRETNVPRTAEIEFSGAVRPNSFPFNLIRVPFSIEFTKNYTENAIHSLN
jgi:hypothetical protein